MARRFKYHGVPVTFMALADLDAEFNGYLARYAYMDDAIHKEHVLDWWKDWSSAHEAANQMIRECFDETGIINDAKFAWIIETKMRLDVKPEIESCFSIVYHDGNEPWLRVDDSRLNIIIKEYLS